MYYYCYFRPYPLGKHFFHLVKCYIISPPAFLLIIISNYEMVVGPTARSSPRRVFPDRSRCVNVLAIDGLAIRDCARMFTPEKKRNSRYWLKGMLGWKGIFFWETGWTVSSPKCLQMLVAGCLRGFHLTEERLRIILYLCMTTSSLKGSNTWAVFVWPVED